MKPSPCVYVCGRWIVGVYGWQPNAIPSSTHSEARHLHSRDTERHPPSLYLLFCSLFTFFLIPVLINPPLPQSPGGRSWETTLLDAAATPDDRLSPLCPASCPATCPVLGSKPSLTFTHYPAPNCGLVGLVRSLSVLILFCLFVALLALLFGHASGSMDGNVSLSAGWSVSLPVWFRLKYLNKFWIDWHDIMSKH